MGLDMYLYAKLFTVGTEHQTGRSKQINSNIRRIMPEIYRTGNLDSIYISFEVGYWRKANQIHNWFVVHVQENNDDCQESYVEREKLKELLALCKKIMKIAKLKKGKMKNGTSGGKQLYTQGEIITNVKEIEALLPTSQGSFFGSYEYDKYYLDQIKDTIKILEKCLTLGEDWEFMYTASW